MTRGTHARFGRRHGGAEPVPAATTLDGTGIEPSPTGRWHRSRAQRRSGWSAGRGVLSCCGGSSASVPGTAYGRARAGWSTRLEKGSLDRGSAARVISAGATCLFVVGDRGEAEVDARVVASIRRATGLVFRAGNEVAAKNHRTGRPGREPPLRPDPRCRPSTLQPSIVPRGGRPAGARGPALRCTDPSGSRHRPAQWLNLGAVAAPRQSASASPNRVIGMSSVCVVPETGLMSCGELSADDAWRTARRYGWRQLLVAGFVRFRYGDGFSHARAFALQLSLAAVPLVIAGAGLATSLGADSVAEVVARTVVAVSPGSSDSLLEQVIEGGGTERGEGAAVVVAGLVTAFAAASSAFAQFERGATGSTACSGTARSAASPRRTRHGGGRTCRAGQGR